MRYALVILVSIFTIPACGGSQGGGSTAEPCRGINSDDDGFGTITWSTDEYSNLGLNQGRAGVILSKADGQVTVGGDLVLMGVQDDPMAAGTEIAIRLEDGSIVTTHTMADATRLAQASTTGAYTQFEYAAPLTATQVQTLAGQRWIAVRTASPGGVGATMELRTGSGTRLADTARCFASH